MKVAPKRANAPYLQTLALRLGVGTLSGIPAKGRGVPGTVLSSPSIRTMSFMNIIAALLSRRDPLRNRS
jgi:hypothetical protein